MSDILRRLAAGGLLTLATLVPPAAAPAETAGASSAEAKAEAPAAEAAAEADAGAAAEVEAEAPDADADADAGAGADVAPGDEEDAIFAVAAEPWTGDLDGIVERGLLRLGTVHNPILLTYDGAEQSGIAVDAAVELQKHLRETLGKEARDLTVVVVPLPRDRLIAALEEGRVDVLTANLTITPERAERVAFTDPTIKEVREVVVTGPGVTVATLDDLVETGLHLRPSSSYAASLATVNAERAAA
ncbi:MAG: transporter substrate-binding domain-containing protein, partial [Pseudomonadota bacterium]